MASCRLFLPSCNCRCHSNCLLSWTPVGNGDCCVLAVCLSLRCYSNLAYFLVIGKNRRLKQAKEEAQAEIEQYRLQREKEFKAKEAAVSLLDNSQLPPPHPCVPPPPPSPWCCLELVLLLLEMMLLELCKMFSCCSSWKSLLHGVVLSLSAFSLIASLCCNVQPAAMAISVESSQLQECCCSLEPGRWYQ